MVIYQNYYTEDLFLLLFINKQNSLADTFVSEANITEIPYLDYKSDPIYYLCYLYIFINMAKTMPSSSGIPSGFFLMNIA